MNLKYMFVALYALSMGRAFGMLSGATRVVAGVAGIGFVVLVSRALEKGSRAQRQCVLQRELYREIAERNQGVAVDIKDAKEDALKACMCSKKSADESCAEQRKELVMAWRELMRANMILHGCASQEDIERDDAGFWRSAEAKVAGIVQYYEKLAQQGAQQ